jgi:hypothetical protein
MIVFVSAEWVMICPATDIPTNCYSCIVVRFLHAKNKSAVEIHRELCAVYSQNIMMDL